MKKTLSIFMTLAMLFCLSANLFTFAADKSVKNSKQISANEAVSKQPSTSNIINAAAIATISACGVVFSAIAGNYYYEKGYQTGRDNNWLSVRNIKRVFGAMFTYWTMSKIGGGIINAISGVGNVLVDAVAGQRDALVDIIEDRGDALVGAVADQRDALVGAVAGQRDALVGAVRSIGRNIAASQGALSYSLRALID